MIWKVDGELNAICTLDKESRHGQAGDKCFPTEYEALRYMFDRSIAHMEQLKKETERTRLCHNKMCDKWGKRLRELTRSRQHTASGQGPDQV